MYEKVNPSHPDKIADRIAGALVDLAYKAQENPKIAVEVLIGHGRCYIITEGSVTFTPKEVEVIVRRITGDDMRVEVVSAPQDSFLSANQDEKMRCGDNGIFKGVPTTIEQKALSGTARELYDKYKSDGKYIFEGASSYPARVDKLIICQSNADTEELKKNYPRAIVNPLGDWTGGLNVDTGATNRKLGSDMGDAVTGGGLHGKDLTKADVSVNIYAHIKAQRDREPVELHCAIGDEYVDGLPYSAIVEIARDYIYNKCGGFEKFAEWGLI